MKTDLCKMTILMTTMITLRITQSTPHPEDLPPAPPMVPVPHRPNPFIEGHITTLRAQIMASERDREIIFYKMFQLQLMLKPDTTPRVFLPLCPHFLDSRSILELRNIYAFSVQNLQREQIALHEFVVCLISNGSVTKPKKDPNP